MTLVIGCVLLAGCATSNPVVDDAVTEIRVINKVDFWFLKAGTIITSMDGEVLTIDDNAHVLITTNLLWDVYQARVRHDEIMP